jgi:hypothetical protein
MDKTEAYYWLLRTEYPEKCLATLATLRPSMRLKEGLDLDKIAGVSIIDGTLADVPVWQAYGDQQVRTAVKRKYGDKVTVKDRFSADPGIGAFSPLGGAMYIRPAAVRRYPIARQEALILHEGVLHIHFGLDDGDILEVLYGRGSRNRLASIWITTWLETNCVEAAE